MSDCYFKSGRLAHVKPDRIRSTVEIIRKTESVHVTAATVFTLIENPRNRVSLTFCFNPLWPKQSNRRGSDRKERDESLRFAYLSVDSLSSLFFHAFSFLLPVSFICSLDNDLFSRSQPTTTFLPHTDLSCVHFIFSLHVLQWIRLFVGTIPAAGQPT